MSEILDSIDSPAAVKNLTYVELEQLAAEIREKLVTTVTNTGGHLASSLGVVELTIALHRVFNSPRDKIIWDVGHQSYAHKLLTGRRERFSSLRQRGGLSGFPDRAESIHDSFGTGHASTSVSAALGMAAARDLAGDDYQVVAVIGDGALTGGMALEGLNQAGHLGTRLIIILNDNGMAISPSVGALARLLNRLRYDRRYHQARRSMERVVTGLPMGDYLWRAMKRVKDAAKSLVVPAMVWERLGFNYVGPIDGHDIKELEQTLVRVQAHPRKPTLIHVITTKGKGYHPAEENAIHFHGVSPNGSRVGNALSYSEVLGQTLLRIAREDSRVVAVTAAMPEGTGLDIVSREFPQRVFDVGICEQHAVTFAAGLAVQGYVPVVAIYSTFLQRAFDQIIHDVCLQNLPVVFAIDRSGIVGEDGKTHQGLFDVSYLNCIPNMVISAPRDENELQHLLYTAVKSNRPMAIRYPRGKGCGVSLDLALHEIPIGKGELLRQGRDVAVLAFGAMVPPAVEAARRLSEYGVEAMVANARFAKPLDEELILKMAGWTGRLVTVEENTLSGGLGSAVSEVLHKSGITDVRVKCIGLPDQFVEHGSREELCSVFALDAAGIVGRVLTFFPELVRTSIDEKARDRKVPTHF